MPHRGFESCPVLHTFFDTLDQCPEWQRERPLNPPAKASVSSSLTWSAILLRAAALRRTGELVTRSRMPSEALAKEGSLRTTNPDSIVQWQDSALSMRRQEFDSQRVIRKSGCRFSVRSRAKLKIPITFITSGRLRPEVIVI